MQNEDKLPFDPYAVFSVKTEKEFNAMALRVFNYQITHNTIYRSYCEHIRTDINAINHYTKIPFLPISFFKTHSVVSFKEKPKTSFSSSGTTGMVRSQHYVKDIGMYEQAFMKGFELAYGSISDYVVIGLLPSYLEREGSSLIYMVDHFIKQSVHPESGFFLNEYEKLAALLENCRHKKVLLIGVSYALLDFGEQFRPDLSHCIVMETGGMKGKRKEMIKSELHTQLSTYFNVPIIHSEYGMTELFSQAYSEGTAFKCPPWMKILTRSYSDPFELIEKKTGGINVIDLANFFSCSFIATEDLGSVLPDHFQVVGRFDNSDIRGCNLLIQ